MSYKSSPNIPQRFGYFEKPHPLLKTALATFSANFGEKNCIFLFLHLVTVSERRIIGRFVVRKRRQRQEQKPRPPSSFNDLMLYPFVEVVLKERKWMSLEMEFSCFVCRSNWNDDDDEKKIFSMWRSFCHCFWHYLDDLGDVNAEIIQYLKSLIGVICAFLSSRQHFIT